LESLEIDKELLDRDNIGINFDQVMKNLDIPNDHEHEIAFEGDSENSN